MLPIGLPPRKPNADDAVPSDPPNPSSNINRVIIVPLGHFVSRPRPIDDEKNLERNTIMYNRILRFRTKLIQDRIATAAALEYSPTDLAVNVKLMKEVIMEGIKNAMVWNSSFEAGRTTIFIVRFKYVVTPGATQVLRVLFPGIGVPNQDGKEKGWNMNFYTAAEFRDIMGTDIIARLGSLCAELSGSLGVNLEYKGLIRIFGHYRELKYLP